MKFLEKNLEDIIFEADNVDLNKRGLPIFGDKRRQIRIGNYGICDLITVKRLHDYRLSDAYGGIHPYLNITVYELKKDFVTINTFLQGIRYIKGIERYLDYRNSYIDVRFNLVLIGSSIDNSNDLIYLPDLLIHDIEEPNYSIGLGLYTYEYDFDGISFKSHKGYKLVNEGFYYGKKIL